jgi:hypothetical protein
MARSPHFSVPTVTKKEDAKSVLPKLNNQGNLLAGATARIGVGFLLNPFSVLKARFEACCATPLEPLVTQLFTERTFCVPKFNWLPCLHCSYRAIRVDAWIRGIVSTGCTIRWIVCPALRSDQARVEQVHVFQHLGMCLKHLRQLILYQAHTPQAYIAFLQRRQGVLQLWLPTLSMLSRYSYDTACAHGAEYY